MFLGCQSTPKLSNQFSADIISVKNDTVYYKTRCDYYVDTELDKSRSDALSKVPAKYPFSASRKGLEGYVRFEFDISEKGNPINLNVIESYPNDIFNAAATKSLINWKYEPYQTFCHVVTLDFKMVEPN